jgi:hypothetical protein
MKVESLEFWQADHCNERIATTHRSCNDICEAQGLLFHRCHFTDENCNDLIATIHRSCNTKATQFDTPQYIADFCNTCSLGVGHFAFIFGNELALIVQQRNPTPTTQDRP